MKRRTASSEELLQLQKYSVPINKIVSPSLLEHESGEFICCDGAPAHELIFLLRGKAKVFVPSESGDHLVLCLYDGFGVLDDMELFLNEGTYHISCQTLGSVTGIALPIIENRSILLSSNDFLRATGLSFAKSMQRNRNHFNNILYPLDRRLCSYISATETNGYWNDNLSRVSEVLGTSYRHLHRTLQNLCDRGVLQKTERGYVITDRTEFMRYDKDFVPMVE